MQTNFDAALRELADWLAETTIDGPTERAARRLLLDTVACAVAGFRKTPSGLLQADLGGHRLLGADGPVGPAEAAYAFAVAACADEACEGLAFAHGRPGLHAVSAGVGAALKQNASLEALLGAIVAGFEVGGRMGALFRAKPGIHVDGAWGLIAAAVAARRVYGGDGAALAAAASAALCQMPAGLYLPVSQGADLRNSYSGHAAAAGMLLAASVASGMTTPTGAIEAAGGYGFRLEPDAWLGPGRWLIQEGYLKAYPSVRHTHYGVEAAKAWKREHPDIEPDAITAVRLEIYPEAVTYCGNRAPTTPIMAQFSLSYTLAHALIHGDLTPDAYEAEALSAPSATRLEALMEIKADETLGREGAREARLAIIADTNEWSLRVDKAPGDAQTPMTDEQLTAKVRSFCRGRIPDDRAERLIDDILSGSPNLSARQILTD